MNSILLQQPVSGAKQGGATLQSSMLDTLLSENIASQSLSNFEEMLGSFTSLDINPDLSINVNSLSITEQNAADTSNSIIISPETISSLLAFNQDIPTQDISFGMEETNLEALDILAVNENYIALTQPPLNKDIQLLSQQIEPKLNTSSFIPEDEEIITAIPFTAPPDEQAGLKEANSDMADNPQEKGLHSSFKVISKVEPKPIDQAHTMQNIIISGEQLSILKPKEISNFSDTTDSIENTEQPQPNLPDINTLVHPIFCVPNRQHETLSSQDQASSGINNIEANSNKKAVNTNHELQITSPSTDASSLSSKNNHEITSDKQNFKERIKAEQETNQNLDINQPIGSKYSADEIITNRISNKYSMIEKSSFEGTKVTDNNYNVSEQISLRFASAVKDGQTKIQVELTPHELGKIEISFEVDSNGNKTIEVLSEKFTTLDILQRSVKELESSLAELGIKNEGTSLNFGLKDHNQQQREQHHPNNGKNMFRDEGFDRVEINAVYTGTAQADNGINILI